MSLSKVPVVRIGDVVDRVTKGTTPTTHGYQYTKDGVAFVRVENLRNGIIDSSSLTTFISVNADRFLKRSSLEKDDVLVSIAGTIGRTAVVREQDLPANTNQAVAIIRGANKTFEPMFLRYALESPLLNRLLRGEARGGAMQNISLEDVKNVELPVPTIDQQRQIVAEIEKQFTRLEVGVAGLRRVQANLRRYRAAVLKAACEGKLVPTEAELAHQEHRSYETGAQLLERIFTVRGQKCSGMGKYKEVMAPDFTSHPKLPEGWLAAPIEVICRIVDGDRGKEYPKKKDFLVDGFCLFLSTNNVRPDGFKFEENQFISREKHERLRQGKLECGDIVVTSRGTIGNVALYDGTVSYDCVRINSGMFILRDFGDVLDAKYFAWYLLKSCVKA